MIDVVTMGTDFPGKSSLHDDVIQYLGVHAHYRPGYGYWDAVNLGYYLVLVLVLTVLSYHGTNTPGGGGSVLQILTGMHG